MADIQQYLSSFLAKEIKQLEELGIKDNQQIQRVSNHTYKLTSEQFSLKDKKKDILQYATFYWLRLQSLKPQVKEAAEIKWDKIKNLQWVTNILDIKPGQLTVIIGTLFKEQPLKPSILKNLQGVLGTRKFAKGLYVSEEDYAVLEDSSGRIRLLKNDIFSPQQFVTGSIVALMGTADNHGFFTIKDYCFAGVPFSSEIPRSIKINNKTALYDMEALKDDKRQFVAFVSGLEFGQPGDVMSSELLLKFIRGELGSPKTQMLSRQITRVIICGNSIIQPEEADYLLRGSYRTQAINQQTYKNISDVLDIFENFLLNLTSHIDVDLMPGQFDFSSSLMPQQMLNSCLFPQLQDREALNLVTNPHSFEINGLQFLGTSGQNIRDIQLYTQLEHQEPIDIIELTLNLRHICPTAPDTLRSFPFNETDPFVINNAPHVYFAGNQEKFQQKLLLSDAAQNKQGVKLISVPSFCKTKSIVLMDLQTLECYELTFDLSQGVLPSRDSAMEDNSENCGTDGQIAMDIDH